jgi:hypothetical protein
LGAVSFVSLSNEPANVSDKKCAKPTIDEASNEDWGSSYPD